MRTHAHRPRGPRPARPAGFTLITVLVLLCIMAGLVAAYGRHVIISGRGGMSSPALAAARETCRSGLTLARQTILSGDGTVPATVPAGDGLAGITVTTVADGHEQFSIQSMSQDGLGAKRTAELALQPVASSSPAGTSDLPTLSGTTVSALLANPAVHLHHITSATTLQSADLTDLYVVHPGVQLQLSDVVLKGAVISSAVLAGAPYGNYNAGQAPRLLIAGNVRIDPASWLPGLTILMPDGIVSTAAADARIQIHGDVVAHDISLLMPGAFEGHAAGVSVALADPSLLDRLGFDRKPPDWSSSLDLGLASEPVFLATVPPSTSTASLAAIIGYWQLH